jgi:hypothetical protein
VVVFVFLGCDEVLVRVLEIGAGIGEVRVQVKRIEFIAQVIVETYVFPCPVFGGKGFEVS